MRISLAIAFLLTITLQLFAVTGKGQSIAIEKVTVGLRDESLETAIKKIEQQCAFRFFYRNADIKELTHLDLAPGARTIEQTLQILLQNTPLSFRQIDNDILLEQKNQQSYFEIKGRIVDSLDKKPVVNASVFLNNASVGSKTNDDGTFTLQNAKPGKYELIVSIIGYESYRKTIIINDRDIVLPDISISRKLIALNEVKIKARPQSDNDRQRYLWWFMNEFLGTSYLAQQCKILNPEVIHLDYDEAASTLTASSDDFIVIENQALGYKIKYLLTNFIQEGKQMSIQNFIQEGKQMGIQKVHYEGSALFENLKGTATQQERWQKERKEVYEGSVMHFLRSLPADRLEEEGFRVFQYPKYSNPRREPDSLINTKIKLYKSLTGKNDRYRDSLAFWEKEAGLPKTLQTLMQFPLKRDDIAMITDQKGIFALGCDYDALLVTYSKKHRFAAKARLDNSESTVVNFNDPYVLFDRNGGMIDPGGIGISFTGAWGKDRLGELLPVDYEPQQNINNNDGNTVTPNNDDQLSSTQLNELRAGLLKWKTVSDSVSDACGAEKIYMQFDKPYYAVGDTIWFKTYLLNEALTGTDKSGFMYVDIANDSNKVVKQYKFPVQDGLSWGSINLDEKEFKTSTYTLRAYTNWMRNFGDKQFFYKRFYVSSANENNWLINKQESVSLVNGANSVDAKLRFSNMNQKPFMIQSLDLQVMAGERHLYKQRLQTDLNGAIDVNFTIPQKATNLAIIAESENKDNKAFIPIILNKPENTDVQFLPEGGNLVAGLPAHIGFKAIGEDGKGVNVSGIIIDHDQKHVAGFNSLHNGIGSFDLDIKAGEQYTAKVTLPGGTTKQYPLPVIKSSGTTLQVKDLSGSDSLAVSVAATKDIEQSGDSYFLIGKGRGIVCYAAIISFKKESNVKRNIAKSLFPTGITHFTLMTTKYQPLNERLVFINHHDNLDINFSTNKSNYGSRDSVALKIKVTDNTGKPIEGNFSLAVTDDAQLKTDSLNNENIISRLLLTADLKGSVEEPGYYLSSTTVKAQQALDNLLLTQGWVGYDWLQVFNPPAITYLPEHEFAVKGNVLNAFNKPVKGTDVLLFSKSPSILMDTVTDKEGKFIFSHFPVIDTPVFILKAVNKHGKSFNVGINVDEAKPPVFAAPNIPAITPWYVNSDTTLLNFTKSNALAKQQRYFPKGLILKEVRISAKKIVKGSQNLNGPGNADLVLDEKDMEKAGKKTWLDLLYEKIPGFREGTINLVTHKSVPVSKGSFMVRDAITNIPIDWYFVKDKWVTTIVDGVEIDSIITAPFPPTLRDLRTFFQSHNAEDIKGIELNFSLKYSDSYINRFIPPEKYNPGWRDYVFIEITTRSGHGPFLDNTPGMYLFKPQPISWPKQFYKPKYGVTDKNQLSDLRSTIHWEPNITTNANGEARLSFYTADKPSIYTLTIEGCDMSGALGSKTGKIIIDNKHSGK